MPFQPLLPFEAQDPSPDVPRLVVELARVCRDRPLEEKVLVAPSLAVGYTLSERLAREGSPWVNLRVETVRTLASDTVAAELTREGLLVLSRAQALAFVEQACLEALGPDSYFGALVDRPGLHRAIRASLDELRGAGLSAESLPSQAFGDSRKHRELCEILRRYARCLEEGRYVDGVEVLRRATAALASRTAAAGEALYLLPAGADLSILERRFLEKLAAGRLTDLPVDPSDAWRTMARRARIFRAIGEENEIREIFRRILEEGVSLDQVELLHTDGAVYPALAWELSREQEIPCTFGEGIAVTYTHPGQVALAFLSWISQGFDSEALRQALASGAVRFARESEDAQGSGPRAAARAMREAAIGWGRDRHRRCLDRLVAHLERPEPPSRDDGEGGPEQREGRLRGRERRLAAARSARDFVSRALELAPQFGEGRGELSALACGLRSFVSDFARVSDELDASARTALEALFREFEELQALRLDLSDACERLRDAVGQLAVASDRPRPGRLHVAHFRSGGFSGRRHTFLVGLDEARAPGRDLEDPVLLDDERRRINKAVPEALLALGREQPLESARALFGCVARLRGALTASYSSYDLRNLSQAGEPSASPFLLDLHREITSRPQADYADLSAALPRAAGFVPEPDAALDETEWWLARGRRVGLRGERSAEAVRASYPWLAQGLRAEIARAGEAFTVWDGRLGAPTPELDPRSAGEPFSPSRVEDLARCPFFYFLKHVLRIEPPRDLEQDRTRWLTPMDEGSLIHEVFKDLLEEITERGEKPDAAHLQRLLAIAQSHIDRWQERVVPRSELALEQTRSNVLFACRTFLRLEQEHCKDVTPRYYEVPFGRPAELSRTRCEIASADPVEIEAGGGRTFALRGSIDRVDEAPDGTFHVWDYKTGAAGRFREGVGVRGGRQIQPALYALAFEALLERAGRPGVVSRSGYFFPGRRGEGRRLEVPLDRDETRQTLGRLFDLVACGYFPHAPGKEDCKYCDFETVCGGAVLAGDRARRKLAASDDPILIAFSELHDRSQEG